MKTNSSNIVSVIFHGLASLLLVLFAVSHFLDLFMGGVFYDLTNPVFGFLSNRTVFLLAGILEMISAIYCWKYRGQNLTNVAVLTFISIILWYRWSFHYVGGYRCNCAGILGKIFHISKANENAISIIALIILFISTVPWMMRSIGQLVCKSHPKVYFMTLMIVSLLANYQSYAAQIIEVRGTYSTAHYNPKSGEIYRHPPPFEDENPQTMDFVALISEKEVRITVTNQADSKWWSEFIYNGTNSYALYSFNTHGFQTNILTPDISAYAAVSPSPYLISDVEDNLGLTTPWLTYGLRPTLVSSNRNGAVEIPLPWMASRQDLFAFGYRWSITPSADGRFVDHLEAVRDQSLDLSDEDELLRPEIRYPTGNLNLRNWLLQKLKIRREIKTGFPGGRYVCTKWYQTNGISVPLESTFKYYWKGYPDKPTYEAVLKAIEIKVFDDPSKSLLENVSASTLVRDYRYRQVRMPRIYEWAQYTNKSGGSWKSTNDSELIMQMESYFKHGVKYNYLGPNNRRVVAIVLLISLSFPLAFLLWRGIQKNKQK